MQPTNTKTLRDDFVEVIRGITPTYPTHQTRWAPVDQREHVPGERLRLFYIRMGFAEQVTDGIYGDGMEKETVMEVWANYAGLPDDIVDSLVSEDGQDLFLALEARIDPTLGGFLSIHPIGSFEPEDEEPGRVWGLHRFAVRFLAPS